MNKLKTLMERAQQSVETIPEAISYSSYKSYLYCPYALGLETSQSEVMCLGGMVHKAIDFELSKATGVRVVGPPAAPYVKQALMFLGDSPEGYLPEEWATEVEVRGTLTYQGVRFPVKGIIDAVGFDGGGRLVFVDWKTTRKPRTDYWQQGLIYKMLLEYLQGWLGEREAYGIRVWLLEDTYVKDILIPNETQKNRILAGLLSAWIAKKRIPRNETIDFSPYKCAACLSKEFCDRRA